MSKESLDSLFDGDLYKISFISIFSLFFLVFKHDFIGCLDLTRIPASDDVTN